MTELTVCSTHCDFPKCTKTSRAPHEDGWAKANYKPWGAKIRNADLCEKHKSYPMHEIFPEEKKA